MPGDPREGKMDIILLGLTREHELGPRVCISEADLRQTLTEGKGRRLTDEQASIYIEFRYSLTKEAVRAILNEIKEMEARREFPGQGIDWNNCKRRLERLETVCP